MLGGHCEEKLGFQSNHFPVAGHDTWDDCDPKIPIALEAEADYESCMSIPVAVTHNRFIGFCTLNYQIDEQNPPSVY